jgi:DnaJ-class molecular chaperone
MSTVTYKVIAERHEWRQCSSCHGTGKKARKFQGKEFIDPCARCSSTGREKITHRTEVPLEEALKELRLLINE